MLRKNGGQAVMLVLMGAMVVGGIVVWLATGNFHMMGMHGGKHGKTASHRPMDRPKATRRTGRSRGRKGAPGWMRHDIEYCSIIKTVNDFIGFGVFFLFSGEDSGGLPGRERTTVEWISERT